MRKYQLIKSAPYCCVAASLESIFKRHGFNDITQYDIANHVGIVVHESDKAEIPVELYNVAFTSDNAKVGMHLYSDTLNNLFNHFRLPFRELYISWQELADWNIDCILQNLSEEDDAILLFDLGYLYHEDRNRGIGHSGLFVSLDMDHTVEYLSPGPRFLGLGKFSSDDFVNAIKAKKGGISVISSNKHSVYG